VSTSSPGMDVGKMAAEGFGQIMNSMDVFKKAWSNLATPFTPTLDVEELDKRIADLRTVEQWLSLNQNMLRSTIQGLEIQRATLDGIKTVSASFSNALKPPDDTMAQTLARFAAAAAQKAVEPAAPEATGSSAARPFGFFDWSPFGMPSSALPGAHTAAPSRAGVDADPPPEADEGDGAEEQSAAEADSGTEADDGAENKAEKATARARSSGPKASGKSEESPVPGMNPLAWWEMLQNNFRQIAQAATGDYALTSSGSLPSPFAFPAAGAGTAAATGGKQEAERAAAGSAASKGGGRGGSGRAKAPGAPASRKSAASTGRNGGSEGSRTKPRRSKTGADKDRG